MRTEGQPETGLLSETDDHFDVFNPIRGQILMTRGIGLHQGGNPVRRVEPAVCGLGPSQDQRTDAFGPDVKRTKHTEIIRATAHHEFECVIHSDTVKCA